MTMVEKTKWSSVGLALLGYALFEYPIISLFKGSDAIFSIPSVFLFLLTAWILFILMVFRLTKRFDQLDNDSDDE